MFDFRFTTKRLTHALAAAIALFGGSRLYRNHFASEPKPLEATAKTEPDFRTENAKPEIERGEAVLVLAYGASVPRLLTSFGVENQTAITIANRLREIVPAKKMKAGQVFNVKYAKMGGKISIESLRTRFEAEKTILIERTDDGYAANVKTVRLNPAVHVVEGKIGGSFYGSALKAGISSESIREAVEVLSFVVNFQHGIKAGATFKVLSDVMRDPEGKIVKVKGLKFIELNTGGFSYRLFAFDDGKSRRFYNERGESVVRSLLQTPIQMSGLRISSGFGTRVHPCLGYTREHKGVDFAAPPGTPVLAAGDGRVVFAGRNGGYGNLVHIVHGNGYETKYAHLKFIDRAIKPGARVSQRQVIGGVGTTGMSTGPHLHFEVILNKRHINPMKVQSLPSVKLTGSLLKKFEILKLNLMKESDRKAAAIRQTGDSL